MRENTTKIRRFLAVLLCLALTLGLVPSGLSQTRQEQMLESVEEILRQRQGATATPAPTAEPTPAPDQTETGSGETGDEQTADASGEAEATPAPEGQAAEKHLAMLKKGTAVYADAGLQKRLGVMVQRGVVYVFEVLGSVIRIGLVADNEVLEGYASADRGSWLSEAEAETYAYFLGRNALQVGTLTLNPVQFKKDAVQPEAAQPTAPAGRSAAEEPAAEEPTSEEPVVEEPAGEEPAAEEPAAEEPAAEEPAAEELVTEEPAAEEPVAEEPATEQPVAEQPAAEEPAAEEPADGAQLLAETAQETPDAPAAAEAASDSAEEMPAQTRAGAPAEADDEPVPQEVRLAAPVFQLQPRPQVVMAGDLTCFTVAAQGAETYQWQYRAAGSDWTDLRNGNVWKGLATATLSFTAKTTWSGWEFRCAATGGGQTVYSDAALLMVNTSGLSSLTILQHPSAQSVNAGERAVFTVSAVNATGYQWQYRAGTSGTWTNLTNANVWVGNKTTTLTFTAKAAWNGWQFRCAATKDGATVYSNPAALTVKSSAPVISGQPASQTAQAGQTVSFSVTASGAESYQWQYSADGKAWTDLQNANVWKGMKTAKLTFTAKYAWTGWRFRCAVSNAAGTVHSQAALLTVEQPAEVTITSQPAAVTVRTGASASFSVTASGAESYQWQYSADGKTWTDLQNANVWKGKNTAKLTFTAKKAWSGWRFRCAVSNAAGKKYSSAAVLTVQDPVTITRQPVSLTVRDGAAASFSAEVQDAVSLQWQYSVNGINWINLTEGGAFTGPKTEQLSFTASLDLNGYRFRLKASDSQLTVYSNTVTLTVTGKVAIESHPEDVSAMAGETVTFSMKASNATGYIWQYKASGSTSWTSLKDGTGITGSRTDTLKIQVTDEQLGGKFRCRVTDGTDVLYTTAATLKEITGAPVFTAPSVTTLQAVDGSTVTIAPQVRGASSYQWQYSPAGANSWRNIADSTIISGVKTAVLTVSVSSAISGYKFRLKATNSYGTSISEEYSVSLLMDGPTGVTASALGRTALSVSWTAPANVSVTGYRVYYNTVKNTATASVTTVTTTGATLTGLTAGTTYYVWVQAYNARMSSAVNDSVMASARTPDPQAKPGAPTNVKATATTASITVTWAAPANSEVSGYYVYYVKTGGTQNEKLTVTGASTLTAAITGLTKETSYQVWVAAYNETGEGTASGRVTVRTLASSPQPEQPSNVRAVSSGMNSVKVSWTASVSENVSGYYVYYSKSSTVSTAVRFGGLVTGVLYLNVTGLTTGTPYFFWVTARAADGTESEMNTNVRAAATPGFQTTEKINAEQFSLTGDKYLGVSYSTYDCQAFVERMLQDSGLYINLAGSNTWYRYITWRGTPEECIRIFGRIPTGAFLFIVEDDGGEPAQFRSDGLGNASHIGVVIHRFDGAIHSSYSRGRVCYSYFADATVPNGGWNRVGLWLRMDYGEDINQILEQIASSR